RPRGSRSTKVTLAAPRESASMPSAPEPAKRSSTWTPSRRGPMRLKIACLTMPWVGRIPLGAFSRRPRASPPETRSFDTLNELRPSTAPGQRLLQLRGEAEDHRFAARRAYQLGADRQAGGVEAERQRDRRLAGAVPGICEGNEIHVLVTRR